MIFRPRSSSFSTSTARTSCAFRTTGDTKAYAAFDTSPYTAHGFSDASAKAFVVDHVAGWYAPFAVTVVSMRPASGPYTMIMVGDHTSDFLMAGSGTVGDSTLDCGNESDDNVGFDFAGQLVMNAPVESASDARAVLLNVAQTAAHEAGHTFGLEHVANTRDIMNPAVSSDVQGFLNLDNPLSTVTSLCTDGESTENTFERLVVDVGAAAVVTADLGMAPDLATARGAVGATCTDSTECASDLCATSDTARFCTTTCTQDSECPATFECGHVDGTRYCLPAKPSGCDYGSGSPSGVLVGFLLLLIARRSSRPSAT